MAAEYKIAIIGSGPAGLSAAVHAAKQGISHVLFERTDHINDTIFKYQKRKHVMATPEILPLRSDLDFKEESREEVIDSWTSGLDAAKANVRLKTEVRSIKGEKGNFELGLSDGSTLTAEYVVLAIGVQGNLNTLRIPGADIGVVQYQLDDPDEYNGEEIAVIGVGDAGLENALALATNNVVSVINTNDDFPRAKSGNVSLIQAAIARGGDQPGGVNHITKVKPKEVKPGELVLEAADATLVSIKCDRVIARIGAQPPRTFLEACGIKFASADRNAIPEVSDTYESMIPGLYIIGALAGYPLIKHCMNQGYEVVEYILGKPIAPADEPLIQKKLSPDIIRMLDSSRTEMTGAELITKIQERAPLFSSLTPLQVREFLIHAELHAPKAGEIVFRRNEFANSLYAILEGEVGIQVNPSNPEEMVRLGPGQFFGEMALISGRRRTTSVVATKPALLLEIDRNTMIRLVRSNASVKRGIDGAAVVRQIKTYLAPQADDAVLAKLVETAEVVSFKRNEVLIEQGKEDDAVYLIRKGSATVSMRVGGEEVVTAYVPAGNYVGEMALVTSQPRTATIRAAIETEAIKIDSAAFRSLLEDHDLARQVNDKIRDRLIANQQLRENAESGDIIKFLVRQGCGEATDVLLIDESLCVRCDNCEKACAETHHGISRLDREAGPTFEMLHVPTSCRHCEDPHCMSDCPPDAIHRAPNGEVFIDGNQCIGCGNCYRNCPYGVIQMAAMPTKKPGLLSWLLFGAGPGPGEDKSEEGLARRTGGKHAVKCDMCKDIDGGPACVRSCPTGAAIRVEPSQFIDILRHARQ